MNTEGDYIGALRHLVIPIAREYQPELVLAALGFDSAYYDDLLENGQGIKAHGFATFNSEVFKVQKLNFLGSKTKLSRNISNRK